MTATRARTGVPDDVMFRPGRRSRLTRAAKASGITGPIVLAGAGYGNDTAFREGITKLGSAYVLGIQSTTSLWPPGKKPLPKRMERAWPPDLCHSPRYREPADLCQGIGAYVAARGMARRHLAGGSNTMLSSGFAAVRVRPAHRDDQGSKPRAEQWRLIGWPPDEAEPTKYWLSTLPAKISRRALVNAAQLRWRIERDYQDLKQELGLGQYAGRGWRGFHHHATLCIAAYGFLLSERAAFPPSGQCSPTLIEKPPIPGIIDPRIPDQT